jgi:hypothetical protein
MDRLSAMLVHLLSLSAALAGSVAAPTIRYVPIEAMIDNLLGGLAADPERAHVADALKTIADGRQDIAAGYTAVNTILQRIEERPEQRALLYARLDAFNTLLDQALAIHQILHSPAINAAELRLGDLQVFQLIQEIYVAPGRSELALIGAVPSSTEKLTARLSKHPLLDRVQITYDARSPYPRLTLSVASRSNSIDWAPARTGFQQKDSSDDELQLLNRGDRYLGRIFTERPQLPFSLASGPLTLAITAAPDATLTATTIVDADEKVLARCVRIVPPVAAV